MVFEREEIKMTYNIKDCTNRELSGAALDSLRELRRRGNESLDSAIETVSSFHDNLIVLQEKSDFIYESERLANTMFPENND